MIEITDENGKLSSIGNYLHVVNYGDQPIEWVRYGNSPYSPVDGGSEDQLFLAKYRSKRDRTPTQETIVIHYKCNTVAGQKPKPGTQTNQASNDQDQQNDQRQTSTAPQSNPASTTVTNSRVRSNTMVGCWRSFPNGGNDTNLQMDSQFTSDGQVISMNYKAGGVVYSPEEYVKAQKLIYALDGNKLTLTNLSIGPSTTVYERDGDRFYLLGDDGNRREGFMIKITCGAPFK